MSTTPNMNADYIVIGGGTAGCILASRLSEDPKTRVILVEAGPGDNSPLIHIPIGFSKLLHSSTLNWKYETTAQTELNGRSIYWPRGKVLGGSSSINGLIWVRGDKQDFEDWAATVGDERWSWQNTQKYFQLCEAASGEVDACLGRDGSIPLSATTISNIAVDAFLAAGTALGLPKKASLAISDANAVGYYLTTCRRGRRVSSAVGYLNLAKKRANLRIVTNTLVSKLLLTDDKVANKVIAHHGLSEFQMQACRGVILAAGAVNSPQLLMLSGIGDAEELSKHGISVRLDSKNVGKNLQDHFGVRIMSKIKPQVTINSDFRRPWRLANYAIQYALLRKGPLTMGGAYAGAFFSPTGAERPSMQVHFLPLTIKGQGLDFHKFSGVTANLSQLRPKSRGTISLRSSQFHDAAVIDPNYLSDPDDQENLVQGLRFVRKLLRHPTFSVPMESTEYAPGKCIQSDEEILQYIKENGSTVFHPVGTCRMGSDAGSVVTPEGRVRGIQGLWVADASIMPTITSGNTNAATAMIAEQISEIIKRH